LIAAFGLTNWTKKIYAQEDAAIDAAIKNKTPEEYIYEIADAVQDQSRQNKEYNEKLNNSINGQSEILKRFVEDFVSKMDEIFKGMGQSIKENITEFGEQQFKNSATVLEEIVQKMADTSNRLIEQQTTSMSSIVDTTSNEIEKISTTLKDNISTINKDTVEAIFGSGLLIVGCMLLLTASLLTFSYYAKPRQKENISIRDAFIIGLSQACAVMPGLSRSGTTIATGLLLGNNKAKMAQFSFLMVIPPILGEALLDVVKMMKGENIAGDIPMLSLVIGFLAAFISGCIACKWMINIVKKGKLIYFAIYCAIAGAVTIACTFLK
jgi:undecaprenyl-diphosphatase UppP